MRRLAAAVLVVAVLVACGRGGGDGEEPGGEESGFRQAAVALCTARDQAGADVKAARTTFYDRSHDVLHDVARALDPVDRAASGRLLEAKQRVETGLDGSPSPADLVAHIQRLADVTRAGLAQLDVDVPACD